MALQTSSTRAQELDRIAIFLEFCTGTRIADKIVLTAYHCLENRIPKSASGGGVKIKVVDHSISPLARETKIDVVHDVALLYLEKSLPAEVPIMPLASPGHFARYCGEYYTSERVTENLDFLVKGVQTLIARHPEPLLQAPPPRKDSARRRK
jgi:hypothetical protein